MKINEDIIIVAEIETALKSNKRFFGERYCPCVPIDEYFSPNS